MREPYSIVLDHGTQPTPSRQSLMHLKQGDLVKVAFRANGRTEPLWVRVGELIDFHIFGMIDEHPVTKGLDCGDVVKVPLEAVIDVKLERKGADPRV